VTQTTAPAAAAKPAPKPRDPNAVPKSYGINLSDDEGNKVRILALRRKDGSFSSAVVYKIKKQDGTTEKKRGASGDHANLEAARKHVDSLAAGMVKDGWKRRQGGGGFKAAADAFTIDNLPKPKNRKK